MLFNKYQYETASIQKRGYSQSVTAYDEHGKRFWIKWILGIEKTATKAKLLSDKLRHLQRARHIALPDIIDYGHDQEQNAYAIVYEYLEEVKRLEEIIEEINVQAAIGGLRDLADCLHELHLKHKINHGDIHPGNILIDGNGQFYLVDFGLTDITRTLSQSSDLEIFAKEFAAPEKLSRLRSNGFPYQADVYSFGKLLEWLFQERQQVLKEESNKLLVALLADNPIERPSWNKVIEIIDSISKTLSFGIVLVSFKNWETENDDLYILQTTPLLFSIFIRDTGDYFIDIIAGEFVFMYCQWAQHSRTLHIGKRVDKESMDEKVFSSKKRFGKKLPFAPSFVKHLPGRLPIEDLTWLFEKWISEKKERRSSGSKYRNLAKEELGFYSELLKKELDVIASNSLRLQFTRHEVKDDEITFWIKPNENFSSVGAIQGHVEEGNDINSEGFEYIISAKADRKQVKEKNGFSGKPYFYDNKLGILKIKDCEHLKKESIPKDGFLFENISKKEEEKNRQLDAIRKVEKNQTQNPDLAYYLFKPDELPPASTDYSALETVFQRDNDQKPLIYSDNQNKAIRNALNKVPFSVIQGPPGTGKTTIITEIVFQLIHQKSDARILITSQTNNAVDQVLENLIKNEIPILRLSGITAPRNELIRRHTIKRKLEGWKEGVKKSAELNFKKLKEKFLIETQNISLFAGSIANTILKNNDWKQTREKILRIVGNNKTYQKLQQLPAEKQRAIILIDEVFGTKLDAFLNLWELHRDWLNTIISLDEQSAINQKLIDSIRVIGATCNHIASKNYKRYNFEFDYVIMDESGKATTAESLVPIVMGKNLVFVGDQRQLRPRLTSTREVEKWLRDKHRQEASELENWEDYFNKPSLFEQVIKWIDNDYKTQLTECRRSSTEQVKFTSTCFYEPEGDDPIVSIPRDKSAEHNLPLAVQTSIVFVDIGSHYRNEFDNEKNHSSLNQESAAVIPEILECLNKYPIVKEYSIGVITGYSAQYRLLKKRIDKKLHQKNLNNIKSWKKQDEKLAISVVDKFQGLEKDIVIVDLVKSGVGLKLGFLEVSNRVNVALSRQKKLLILVGDYYSIVNATTRKNGGQKVALQKYLELIKPEWRIKASEIRNFFK